WISDLDTTITGNLTCTIDSARTSKVILMSEFTVGAGKTYSIAGNARDSGSSDSALSGALSGLPNIEHLFIGVVGVEGPSGDGYTETSMYTTNVRAGTTGGGAAGNQTANIARFVNTSVSGSYGDLSNLGSSRDWVAIVAAIDEVDEGVGNPRAVIISKARQR
ncbi:MAG: hypothetical protein V3W37_10380, partial [Candidatus Binatia bacterium]